MICASWPWLSSVRVEINQGVRLASRRGHWDNVASMAWGARNLISTQVDVKEDEKTSAAAVPIQPAPDFDKLSGLE